jgi:thioredoxin 1
MTQDAVAEITEQSFQQEVLTANVPVMVEFTAKWCLPCRALAPLLASIAIEGAGRMKVVAVNSDTSPSLASRYGVRALPTVIVFVNGNPQARHVGLTTKAKLLSMIEAVATTREPSVQSLP